MLSKYPSYAALLIILFMVSGLVSASSQNLFAYNNGARLYNTSATFWYGTYPSGGDPTGECSSSGWNSICTITWGDGEDFDDQMDGGDPNPVIKPSSGDIGPWFYIHWSGDARNVDRILVKQGCSDGSVRNLTFEYSTESNCYSDPESASYSGTLTTPNFVQDCQSTPVELTSMGWTNAYCVRYRTYEYDAWDTWEEIKGFKAFGSIPSELLVNFVSPTPDNGTSQSESNVEINVSVAGAEINETIYDWNGVNFTSYNDSLVLMMNFDDYTRLNDTSLYKNNGSCTDCPTWSSDGRYGGAYTFNGASNYIEIPNSDSLELGNKLTISFWLKAGVPASDSQITLAKAYDSTDYTGDWWFEAYHTANMFKFYLTDSGGGHHDVGIPSSVLDNTWHHILGTYDGTTQSLYFDGEFYGSTTWSGTLLNRDQSIYVGRAFSHDPVYGSRWFDGSIDELMIWNKALSADEAYQQYASNFRKSSSTQWYLYVNQSEDASTGLDEGTYTYACYAQDNSSSESDTGIRSITIDSTAPSVSWNWTDINSTISVNYTTICVNTSEAVNCTLRLNGTAYTNSSSGTNICWTRTDLSNGYYSSINVSCEDAAGNSAESTNAWMNVSRSDVTSPVLTWTWTVNTSSTSSPLVTLSADETLLACNLNISGTNYSMSVSNDSASYSWSPSVGGYWLRAYCNDSANNTGTTSIARFTKTSSGGGSSCSKRWDCTDWSDCGGGEQTRTCKCDCLRDKDCYGDHDESRSCTVEEIEIIIEEDPEEGEADPEEIEEIVKEIETTMRLPERGNVGIEVEVGINGAGSIIIKSPAGRVIAVDITDGEASFTPDEPGIWSVSYTEAGKTVTRTVGVAGKAEEAKSIELTTSIIPPATESEASEGYDLTFIVLLPVLLIIVVLFIFGKSMMPRKPALRN